jgi:D-alanyl-D-alanine carboxypeptidase (penicillin-binding protein 5/6)
MSDVKCLPPLIGTMALLAIPAALLGAGAPPEPHATAWLLADGATGEILAQHDIDTPRPMASTTKMMTALVAMDSGDLDRIVTVPPAAVAVGESSAGLKVGERMSLRQLLRGLLVGSGNDAAIAIAYGVAGSESAFVDLMNQKAKEMGLTNTHFVNPHGLDAAGHYSSPRDLLTMGEAVMKQPLLRAIVGNRSITVPGPDGPRRLTSENDLLSALRAADGVKTGHTNHAGYVEVAHATDPVTGVGLFAVVMGDANRAQRAADEKALLTWGFSNYAKPTVLPKGTAVVRVPVQGAPGTEASLVAGMPVSATVRVGKPIRVRISAPSQLVAPLAAGARAGTVEVLQDNAVVARRSLVVSAAVASPGLTDAVRSAFEGIGSVFT